MKSSLTSKVKYFLLRFFTDGDYPESKLTYLDLQRVRLAAVSANGLAIRYIKKKDQTLEMCLAAVKQNGHALEYIDNQTPEICLTAVRQNANAIKHVKYQTLHVCLSAVSSCGSLLVHVKGH